jgi:hypothetical protein
MVDAVNELPTVFRRDEVVTWFRKRYPAVKPSSVTAHITAATVNSASRHHYPGADQHLIFKRADGALERYNPSRHGKWNPYGELVPATGLGLSVPTVGRSVFSARTNPPIDSGRSFEDHARRVCSALWGVPLGSAVVEVAPGLGHQFDLVSLDAKIVGDAKWFKNLPVPAAKWSVIAEYVWLLQHVAAAEKRFLVFGQDREVPQRWLVRFRPLIGDVEFFFLDDSSHLTQLA